VRDLPGSRADDAPDRENRLCVDHDHVTGKVRGILCDRCNSGIGRFSDDPKLLAAAAAYLQKRVMMSE
jgi:hypothetical protein